MQCRFLSIVQLGAAVVLAPAFFRPAGSSRRQIIQSNFSMIGAKERTMNTIPTTALLGLASLALLCGSPRLWGGPGSGPAGAMGARGPETSQTSADADKLNAALIGAAVDPAGNVYLADSAKNIIQKIGPGGAVSTLAGSEGIRGYADGSERTAQFNGPQAVAVDISGNVYVADSGNHAIRKISVGGGVTTLAGAGGVSGNADGTGSSARFASPQGLAIDLRGNVYVADTRNHSIRKITPLGVVSTVAGAGFPGYADGSGRDAKFYAPSRIAIDPSGNLYVTDTGNNVIRKVTEFGVATTLAGSAERPGRGAQAASYADGMGTAARFNSPEGIVIDENGNLVVADSGNAKVRKVTRGGEVSTIDGVDCPRRHRDAFDRRNRNRRNTGLDLFVFGGFERVTGNYIAGGVPSPGDIDVRPGKTPPSQFFEAQTGFIGGRTGGDSHHHQRR